MSSQIILFIRIFNNNKIMKNNSEIIGLYENYCHTNLTMNAISVLIIKENGQIGKWTMYIKIIWIFWNNADFFNFAYIHNSTIFGVDYIRNILWYHYNKVNVIKIIFTTYNNLYYFYKNCNKNRLIIRYIYCYEKINEISYIIL